jgi:hypothetical protein
VPLALLAIRRAPQVDVGTIGVISLASLPYSSSLWALVVDALLVPCLSERLGWRRRWLVASELDLDGGDRILWRARSGGGLAGLRCAAASAQPLRTLSPGITGPPAIRAVCSPKPMLATRSSSMS